MKIFPSGFTVAAIAPAGAVKREVIDSGRAALEALGAQVKVMPHTVCCNEKLPYLAATDEERAADLTAAWCDPEIDLLWCIRGGYGCVRLLSLLDWQSLPAEKTVAGFSDITALHLAMTKLKRGIPLVLPMFGFLGDGLDDETLASLKEVFASGFRGEKSYQLPALHGEVAEGFPLPANLCVAASLAGTPYLPDTAGRLILIEEIGEAPYRADRMLTQLRLTGFFRHCAGIVFGKFTDCGSPEEIDAVLADFAQYVTCPVFTGLNFGHTQPAVSISTIQKWRISALS